jgi:hypothetical protein
MTGTLTPSPLAGEGQPVLRLVKGISGKHLTYEKLLIRPANSLAVIPVNAGIHVARKRTNNRRIKHHKT